MPVGTQPLWHANYKINADVWGFNMKFHFNGLTEADAKARANLIGAYIKKLIPQDSEVFFASISRDNTKKDSRFLRDATGVGAYVLAGVDPPPSKVDNSRSCLLIRMEHEDGSSVTRKFAPLPDVIIAGNMTVGVVPDVTAPVVGAIPAPGAGADWYAEMGNFLKYLIVNTVHVVSLHEPGGEFTYFPWTGAYPIKVGTKKGARVFH